MSMYRFITIVLLAGLVGGCKPASEPEPAAVPPPGGALAYAHQLTLEASAADMRRIVQLALDTCARIADQDCTMLASEMTHREAESASVKLRATPQGVRQIIAAVSALGTVSARSTTAEDLSEPLQDSARQLKMLADYRARLEAMAARPDVRTAELIEVQRELARLAQEVDQASSEQASLRRRVATEVLTINVKQPYHATFAAPIREAARDFAANLARGIAFAITATAFLLPAGIVLVVLLKLAGVARRWWRKRALARVAAPG